MRNLALFLCDFTNIIYLKFLAKAFAKAKTNAIYYGGVICQCFCLFREKVQPITYVISNFLNQMHYQIQS